MKKAEIIILGGGPAGLAAAYYAQKKGKDFILLEANSETGGNCRTIKHGDFYFDTGAHRFHDKDKQVTEEIKELMGKDLMQVEAPSQICFKGKLIDFPLSPYNLLRKLSAQEFFLASWQLLKKSLPIQKETHNFEAFATRTYGNFIAHSFLTNYSEKLWGLPCNRLSKNISGKRLKGLDLKTFLIEGLLGKIAKTRHIDGIFYYPKKGFGDIMKQMERALPQDRIRKNSKVTEIISENKVIRKIIINGNEEMEAEKVINTLPLTLTLKMLNDKMPSEIAEAVSSLKYRHLVLAVFMLDKEKFSANASVYFPEKEVPFTRIYEPKNRSKELAPSAKTCIVVEIPCQMEDSYWKMDDSILQKEVEEILCSMSLLKNSEVIDFISYKIPFAYPILETGFEEKASLLTDYLAIYSNMHLSGRSALFTYSHLHDQMKWGKEIVDKI